MKGPLITALIYNTVKSHNIDYSLCKVSKSTVFQNFTNSANMQVFFFAQKLNFIQFNLQYKFNDARTPILS